MPSQNFFSGLRNIFSLNIYLKLYRTLAIGGGNVCTVLESVFSSITPLLSSAILAM